MTFPKEFWQKKYTQENLRWDIGYVSPPLKAYIDQLDNKALKILVPGAGNGYEVEYLWQEGFKNIFVIDIAPEPLRRLKEKLKQFPGDRLIEGDFFELRETGFDLILEQTFFCALPPRNRPDYVSKMYNLLKPGGKLAGLFFSFPLTEAGPPFGGDTLEYQKLFSPYFSIHTLEPSRNSIPPRQGNELFFIFERKSQKDEE